MEKHDVVIVGGGVAGLTCAKYIDLSGKDYVLISKLLGGNVFNASTIYNFPTHREIEGSILATEMVEATNIDKIVFDSVVSYKDHVVKTESGEEYYGKAIIVATGSNPVKLNMKTPDECVYYCAICDGYKFRDKQVVVLGGSESAAQTALYLSSICEDVFLVFRKDEMSVCSYTKELLNRKGNIHLYSGKTLDDIVSYHSRFAFIFSSSHGENDASIIVDGCFVMFGSKPATDFLKGSKVELDDKGYIIHGTDKFYTRTTEDCVFTCGDCMSNIYRQIVISIGNGATCALDVIKYLEGK